MASKFTVKVKDTDKGWRKLLGRIKRDRTVEVGVRGDDNFRGESIGNVALATVHEFGAEISRGDSVFTIPERSFLRSTMDDNAREYRELIKRANKFVFSLKLTPDKMMELIGMRMVSDVRRKIQKGIPPRLADSTLKQKPGKTTPLIDTGVLINSITYEVTKK